MAAGGNGFKIMVKPPVLKGVYGYAVSPTKAGVLIKQPAG